MGKRNALPKYLGNLNYLYCLPLGSDADDDVEVVVYQISTNAGKYFFADIVFFGKVDCSPAFHLQFSHYFFFSLKKKLQCDIKKLAEWEIERERERELRCGNKKIVTTNVIQYDMFKELKCFHYVNASNTNFCVLSCQRLILLSIFYSSLFLLAFLFT